MRNTNDVAIREHFRNEKFYFVNQLIQDEEDLEDVEDDGEESDETYNPHPFLENLMIDAAKVLE
jgi:hypothetical protein